MSLNDVLVMSMVTIAVIERACLSDKDHRDGCIEDQYGTACYCSTHDCNAQADFRAAPTGSAYISGCSCIVYVGVAIAKVVTSIW